MPMCLMTCHVCARMGQGLAALIPLDFVDWRGEAARCRAVAGSVRRPPPRMLPAMTTSRRVWPSANQQQKQQPTALVRTCPDETLWCFYSDRGSYQRPVSGDSIIEHPCLAGAGAAEACSCFEWSASASPRCALHNMTWSAVAYGNSRAKNYTAYTRSTDPRLE
jgi:hypothetical protein